MMASVLAINSFARAVIRPQDYDITWSSPSESSLGAMPIGNGRTSANVYVDAKDGDLLLLIGLADAFDENSNLLKLGRLRARFDPPLYQAEGTFKQSLQLRQGSIEISTPYTNVSVWVDANSSNLKLLYTPTTNMPVAVNVTLENWRLKDPINAGAFGNGWGGAGGSFCLPNGSIADNVYIYPDTLADISACDDDISLSTVSWYHRNDRSRADYFADTMREQGLGSLIDDPEVFNPLLNRTFGATLSGTRRNHAEYACYKKGPVTLTSPASIEPGEWSLVVHSAQTASAADFVSSLAQRVVAEQRHFASAASHTHAVRQRQSHIDWWAAFFNRSYVHIYDDTSTGTGTSIGGYTRTAHTVGDQSALLRNPSWPIGGDSPRRLLHCPGPVLQVRRAPAGADHYHPETNTSHPSDVIADVTSDVISDACALDAARLCDATPRCASFALSRAWRGGEYAQLYANGLAAAAPNAQWTFFAREAGPAPSASPSPPPPLSTAFLVSRQAALMRYMDACSSGRLGGGAEGSDFFALKYNGGILTAEPSPKEDYRAWGPGQWWQNLRLPYYAMLRAGDADLFRPLLRWYRALLPLALKRTALWYSHANSNATNSANATNAMNAMNAKVGEGAAAGAFFIETMTQFGTFLASEKGYHCPAARAADWPVWWAGNACVNLHREGSVELLLLGLDYFAHTQDEAELRESVVPLAVGVMDWVRTAFGGRASDDSGTGGTGRTSSSHGGTGTLDIWPTQSLEGYQCRFPPTRESCISDDMPMVAGLHAVLPRLLHMATATAAGKRTVTRDQVQNWEQLLRSLPPLPVTSVKPNAFSTSNVTVFTAAQFPLAPNASHTGTEIPMMYPVHPYRLATVLAHPTPTPEPAPAFAPAPAHESSAKERGPKHKTKEPKDQGSGDASVSSGVSLSTLSLAQVARDTYTHGGGYNGNAGWDQGLINAAYLGMADAAWAQVAQRGATVAAPMRFPAYLPSMQDFRPNEDHLSNMRVALHAMLVMHEDPVGVGGTAAGAAAAGNAIAVFPAWPCHLSVDFKLHLPMRTVLQGAYNHSSRKLSLHVQPPQRRGDVKFLGCVNESSVVFTSQ